MVEFTSDANGVYTKCVYVGVPLKKPFTEFICETDEAFVQTTTGDVDLAVACVDADSSLLKTLISRYSKPIKDSQMYKLPRGWGENHTSLCVHATGMNKEKVDSTIDDILGLTAYIPLVMLDQFVPQFQEGIKHEILNYGMEAVMFANLLQFEGFVEDASTLQPGRSNIAYQQLGNICLSQFRPNSSVEILSPYRFEFSDSGTSGVADLLYFVDLGAYGFMIHSGPHMGEEDVVPRSMAGYMLHPEAVYVAGSSAASQIGSDNPMKGLADAYIEDSYFPKKEYSKQVLLHSPVKRTAADIDEVGRLAELVIKATP